MRYDYCCSECQEMIPFEITEETKTIDGPSNQYFTAIDGPSRCPNCDEEINLGQVLFEAAAETYLKEKD